MGGLKNIFRSLDSVNLGSGWTREEVLFSLFCSKQASKTSVMSRLSGQ